MDSARSRVLLIGASRFNPGSGLRDLPSVPAGIAALRRILVDPRLGGLQPDVCRSLVDPASTADVAEAFERCVDEAEHTLLVYYSGHGLPDPHNGALHLAVGSTHPRRVHTSAVPIEWIRRGLSQTQARTTVVILDCCYAGRAIRTMSATLLAAEVDVEGSFVMVAAPANSQAVAPEGERFTAFTGALIRVLEDGVAQGPRHLDLDLVFSLVRADLNRRQLPSPGVQRSDDAARLALVRNVAASVPTPPSAEPARPPRTDDLAAAAPPPPAQAEEPPVAVRSPVSAPVVRAARARRSLRRRDALGIAAVSLLGLAALAVALWPSEPTANAGVLTQQAGSAGCFSSDPAAVGCTIAPRLEGAHAVALSPDGTSVYVAAAKAGAVTVFARSKASGELRRLGCLGRDTGDGICTPVATLDQPEAMAVSPDGRNVYVASYNGNAVTAFARATRNGSLTPIGGSTGCISNDGSGGCASGAGLVGANALSISSDGKSVYVGSATSGAVAILRRARDGGGLSQPGGTAGCIEDGGGDGCASGRALSGAESVTVSPDGRSVYVVSGNRHAVAVLDRSPSGALSQSAALDGCVSNRGTGGCTPVVALQGEDGPDSVAVSGDGRNVYVAARTADAVAILGRSARGDLTMSPARQGCISRNHSTMCERGRALLGASSVAVSADGKSVYVGAYDSYAVASFDRNPRSGALRQKDSPQGCVVDHAPRKRPCAQGRALVGVESLTVSPDGRNVYAASYWSGAVAIFDRR